MRLMVLLGLLACGGNETTQTTEEAATATPNTEAATATPNTEATTGETLTPVNSDTTKKVDSAKAKNAATLETTTADNKNNNNTENTVKETK